MLQVDVTLGQVISAVRFHAPQGIHRPNARLEVSGLVSSVEMKLSLMEISSMMSL